MLDLATTLGSIDGKTFGEISHLPAISSLMWCLTTIIYCEKEDLVGSKCSSDCTLSYECPTPKWVVLLNC